MVLLFVLGFLKNPLNWTTHSSTNVSGQPNLSTLQGPCKALALLCSSVLRISTCPLWVNTPSLFPCLCTEIPPASPHCEWSWCRETVTSVSELTAVTSAPILRIHALGNQAVLSRLSRTWPGSWQERIKSLPPLSTIPLRSSFGRIQTVSKQRNMIFGAKPQYQIKKKGKINLDLTAVAL